MTAKLGCLATIAALAIACSSPVQQEDQSTGAGGKADDLNECTELEISLEPAFGSFTADRPTVLLQDPDTLKWFVAEKKGVIHLVKTDGTGKTTFADIKSKVNSTPNEMGLLGMALHPNFKTNGLVFLQYNPSGAQKSRISRFGTTDGGTKLNVASEKVLIEISQPFTNHKGGSIVFGPDGFLYIGFGDGGSGGDPMNNGQNKNVLLGKILRINVDSTATKGYSIPTDNPFANGGGKPEIFAYGIRNPWQFSFDRETDKLWVADVGQDEWEEIDIVTKGGNYGWPIREGKHCFKPATGCATAGLTDPVEEYDHSIGQSITGGFVYRGKQFPALDGQYIFADFASGIIGATPADLSAEGKVLLTTELNIGVFGQDVDGELYAVDHFGGKIYKVAGPDCVDCPAGETLCDGECTDTDSDVNNCGECGNACDDGETCTDGECGGADDGFSAVYAIIVDRCKLCHVDGEFGKLSMKTESTAYMNLVNKPSNATGPCKNRTRVTPGEETTSLLYQKVTNTAMCGQKMPPSGAPLTAAQLALIKTWIENGAKP